jgi:hypothetical protein
LAQVETIEVQEEYSMPKPVRAILAGCALLLAASISASTALAAKPSGNPASVKFKVAPKKFVCLNDFVPIVISYDWDLKSGVDIPVPLAPLLPQPAPQPDEPPPGTLTTIPAPPSPKGWVSKPNVQVGYGPGEVHMQYSPDSEGKETLVTKLTYGKYVGYDQVSFDVGVCNYNLVIKAWNDQKGSGTTDTSYFSAEGPISISEDDTISGELRTDVWFDIVSDNPLLECNLVPIPMGNSTLTVSGTRTTDDAGIVTLHMKVKYAPITLTPDSAQVKCTNKMDGTKIDTPFNYPKKANPGDYLKEKFDFVNMAQIKGPYGKGGQAFYIIEKLQ